VEDQRAFYDIFFPKPDLAFYFQLPVDVAAKRAIGRNPLKWYEAGMDMSFSENIIDSFMQFQTRVIAGYDQAAQSDHLHIIDGTKPVYETTPDVIRITAEYFKKKYHVSLGSAMTAAAV
jgi:thymidylate kinase